MNVSFPKSKFSQIPSNATSMRFNQQSAWSGRGKGDSDWEKEKCFASFHFFLHLKVKLKIISCGKLIKTLHNRLGSRVELRLLVIIGVCHQRHFCSLYRTIILTEGCVWGFLLVAKLAQEWLYFSCLYMLYYQTSYHIKLYYHFELYFDWTLTPFIYGPQPLP